MDKTDKPETAEQTPVTESQLSRMVDWNMAPAHTVGYSVSTDENQDDHATWLRTLPHGVHSTATAPVFFGLKPGQIVEINMPVVAEDTPPVERFDVTDACERHKVLAVDPGTGHAEYVTEVRSGCRVGESVNASWIKPEFALQTADDVAPMRLGENPHSDDISGYRKMTDAEVAAINHLKAFERHLGDDLALVFSQLHLQRQTDCAQAARWRSIARTHFEEGFSALVRSVALPAERFRNL